jgi:hypothetical protein
MERLHPPHPMGQPEIEASCENMARSAGARVVGSRMAQFAPALRQCILRRVER